MKKKYAIYYEGVFRSGYVTFKATGKHGAEISTNTIADAKKNATRFRFEWVAKFWCYMCNKDANRNFTLKTFKVVEL